MFWPRFSKMPLYIFCEPHQTLPVSFPRWTRSSNNSRRIPQTQNIWLWSVPLSRWERNFWTSIICLWWMNLRFTVYPQIHLNLLSPWYRNWCILVLHLHYKLQYFMTTEWNEWVKVVHTIIFEEFDHAYAHIMGTAVPKPQAQKVHAHFAHTVLFYSC